MYHVGQKITWLSLIAGKATKVIGEIIELESNFWIRAKGKTNQGLDVKDLLTVDDQSISPL